LEIHELRIIENSDNRRITHDENMGGGRWNQSKVWRGLVAIEERSEESCVVKRQNSRCEERVPCFLFYFWL